MIPRPRRILAIARRDWAIELGGRRGWVMPALLVGLLAPVAGIPLRPPQRPPPLAAQGDVPPEVAAIPGIEIGGGTLFRRDADGRLVVSGGIAPPVREALGRLDPPGATVRLVDLTRPPPVPGRSVLFGLIASSTLTGSIASSIAGERSGRTLGALLSASVTRAELVLGKWLAWGSIGVISSWIAAVVAMAAGRVGPGPWLLALPMVPLGTVAFGLWLVRRAGDPLTGTTAAIRAVPALLGIVGLIAWVIGLDRPWAAAAIPIGGALLASGDTWGADWTATGISIASCALAITGLVWATARDLDDVPEPAPWPVWAIGLAWAAVGAVVIWPMIAIPVVFAQVGDPVMAARIDPTMAVWAVSALTGWATAVGLAAERIGSTRPTFRWRGLLLGVPGGVALWAIGEVSARMQTSDTGWIAMFQERTRDLAAPLAHGLAPTLLLLLADELLFRGVLQRRIGPWAGAACWWLVRLPFDPLLGLASGLGLAFLAQFGFTAPLIARLVWALLAAGLIGQM